MEVSQLLSWGSHGFPRDVRDMLWNTVKFPRLPRFESMTGDGGASVFRGMKPFNAFVIRSIAFHGFYGEPTILLSRQSASVGYLKTII